MSIEERIAEILRGAGVCEVEPSRGSIFGCSPESAAAVLVAELGLTREWGVGSDPDDLTQISFSYRSLAESLAHIKSNERWVGERDICPGVPTTRYVTDWELA